MVLKASAMNVESLWSRGGFSSIHRLAVKLNGTVGLMIQTCLVVQVRSNTGTRSLTPEHMINSSLDLNIF